MKKQIRQISKLAGWLMACVLISGIFSPQALAQNRKRVAETTDVWYLDYTVTVKGNGKIEDAGEPTIYWKVNRIYTGTVALASGELISKGSGKEAAEDLKTKRFIRYTTFAPKINIKIDDYVISTDEQEICGDTTKTVDKKTWEADVKGWTSDKLDTSLTIDNQKPSHNVSIPILLELANDNVKNLLKFKRVWEETTTTAAGETSHTEQILQDRNKPVSSVPIPRIFGLLEDERIRHRDYEPLKIIDGGYEYESVELTADDPILENINTEGKVKIQVYYRFKK